MLAELPVTSGVAPQSLRLAVRGFELCAERWRGGSRRHVLLVHGLGGNSVTWHGAAPLLAQELEADVLALDLPGFGRSRSGGRPLTYGVLFGVLEAVLRSEAPSGARWVIAGNSLGAVLALDLACRVPELVSGVGVAAPALPLFWGRSPRGVAAFRGWVLSALPWLGRRVVARYMKKTGVPGIVDEPIAALFGDPRRLDGALRERLLGVSGARLGWVDEAARAYEEVTRGLGLELLLPGRAARGIRSVRCPVLAIRGDRDPIYPEAPWQRLRALRPDWEYVTLEGIGHVPQLEAPDEVARFLADWVARRVA